MGKRKCGNKQTTKDEDKNPQNTEGVIVLGVLMHCQGCVDTIVKHLRGFDGVEQIEADMKTHRVTVKGKSADPIKVVRRLRKKTKKHVELISPILKAEEEEEQEEEKKETNEQPKIFEVVLKIYMYCERCGEDIKRRIHKMHEVHTVEIDMKNSQVTVKGTFEPKKLVDYIRKKAGKHAVIVKQTPPEKKEDDNKQTEKKADDNKHPEKKEDDNEQPEKKAGDNKEPGKKEDDNRQPEKKADDNRQPEKKADDNKPEKEVQKFTPSVYYEIYRPCLVYAPQQFSDENPNACLVM